MRPDGSVIFARTAEPRVLIQLPIDLRTADEYERRIRIAERRPMVKREFEVFIFIRGKPRLFFFRILARILLIIKNIRRNGSVDR